MSDSYDLLIIMIMVDDCDNNAVQSYCRDISNFACEKCYTSNSCNHNSIEVEKTVKVYFTNGICDWICEKGLPQTHTVL